MLTDTLLTVALLGGVILAVWGLSLAITTDQDAGNYPGRMEDE
jgi:hypothetical protein